MYHTITIVFLKQYALSIESGASWLKELTHCWVRVVLSASWPGRVAWVRVDLLPPPTLSLRQSLDSRVWLVSSRPSTSQRYWNSETVQLERAGTFKRLYLPRSPMNSVNSTGQSFHLSLKGTPVSPVPMMLCHGAAVSSIIALQDGRIHL